MKVFNKKIKNFIRTAPIKQWNNLRMRKCIIFFIKILPTSKAIIIIIIINFYNLYIARLLKTLIAIENFTSIYLNTTVAFKWI